MNLLILPISLCKIVSLLFVYKDDPGIIYPTKVDMPSNNEIKPKWNGRKDPWQRKRLFAKSVGDMLRDKETQERDRERVSGYTWLL